MMEHHQQARDLLGTRPQPPTTTASSLAGTGAAAALAALPLLRNVLLFGDSLTSGAYYRETGGGRRMELVAHSWAPEVQRTLRHLLCDELFSNGAKPEAHLALGRSAAECLTTAPVRVVSKGYPGKASRELLDRLRRVRRLSDFSLVAIMSGTNDVVGMRSNLAASVGSIEAMHRVAHSAVCQESSPSSLTCPGSSVCTSSAVHVASRRETCGTVALLPPPFNYSLEPEWYRQQRPRGYCSKEAAAIASRGQQLLQLLRSSPVVGRCAMDWTGHGLDHNRERGNRSLWSDCLHPNAAGYDVFGTVVGRHLWLVATGKREKCFFVEAKGT